MDLKYTTSPWVCMKDGSGQDKCFLRMFPVRSLDTTLGVGTGASDLPLLRIARCGNRFAFLYPRNTSEYIDDPNPLSKQWILEIREAFQTFQPLTATGYCPPNMAPVYRLWNNRVDSNHRYTTALTTAQRMLAQGWVAKGYGPNSVVMCALR